MSCQVSKDKLYEHKRIFKASVGCRIRVLALVTSARADVKPMSQDDPPTSDFFGSSESFLTKLASRIKQIQDLVQCGVLLGLPCLL